MNLKESFLADIKANMGDDVPRLIMADAMEETGEWTPERAELVRVMCQTRDRGAASQLGQIQRLLAIGKVQQWNMVQGAMWLRGFVDQFQGPADRWLRWGDGIVAEHPVRRVQLTTLPQLQATPGDWNDFVLEGREKRIHVGNFDWDKNLYLELLRLEWEGIEFTLLLGQQTGPRSTMRGRISVAGQDLGVEVTMNLRGLGGSATFRSTPRERDSQ